jgi:hypothetical protein
LLRPYSEYDYKEIFSKKKFKKAARGRIRYVLMENKFQLARKICNDMDIEIFELLRDNKMTIEKATLTTVEMNKMRTVRPVKRYGWKLWYSNPKLSDLMTERIISRKEVNIRNPILL